MTTTERTMQASKQPNEQRLLTAKVVDGYLALLRDRVQHNVRRRDRQAVTNVQLFRPPAPCWPFDPPMRLASPMPACQAAPRPASHSLRGARDGSACS